MTVVMDARALPLAAEWLTKTLALRLPDLDWCVSWHMRQEMTPLNFDRCAPLRVNLHLAPCCVCMRASLLRLHACLPCTHRRRPRLRRVHSTTPHRPAHCCRCCCRPEELLEHPLAEEVVFEPPAAAVAAAATAASGGGGGSGMCLGGLRFRGLRASAAVVVGDLGGVLVGGQLSGQLQYSGRGMTALKKVAAAAKAGQVRVGSEYWVTRALLLNVYVALLRLLSH